MADNGFTPVQVPGLRFVMAHVRPTKLDPPLDVRRDHILGNPEAELIEYGNYARHSCRAAHEVVADLRDRFGARLRYAFRHRPAGDDGMAQRAATAGAFTAHCLTRCWELSCGSVCTKQDCTPRLPE